jgi:tetratricopeptide (TPR) repeat protein/class 3 adenylate cyclase/predicted Ser/Thr protein kinase
MNQPQRPDEVTRAEIPQPHTDPGPTPATDAVGEDTAGPALPEQFGRYRLVSRLGVGGMGAVFLAHDTEVDRPVALKVPRFDAGDSTLGRERFLREARSAATLRHPNVCPVYDVGVVEGTPYLTMAYIDGRPLHHWAAELPGRPPTAVAGVLVTLARALDEAHRQGLVHRDLKPSNVLVDRRGEPVLIDFGLARRARPDEARLTTPGVMMGTPAYMPPEQVLGDLDAVGPASDIYSLGVILFELLTGRLPFTGTASAAVTAAILREEPPAPSSVRTDLDPAWDAVVLRALAKEPARRWPSMADFADALAGFLSVPAVVSRGSGIRPPTPATGAGLDPSLAAQALDLLRRGGWSMGMQQLRHFAHRSRDSRRRAAWARYVEALSGDRRPEAECLADLAGLGGLAAWALAGRASLKVRDRDYAAAHRYLERAAREADPDDATLLATVAHVRGTALHHQGRFDAALPHLHDALRRFGRDHPASGRVLDTFGMVYAGKGHFHVAGEFYEQALEYKRRHDDEAGLAVTHGQLGRLFLDWGRLDEAEEHFQADLSLAQKNQSRYSEAQMCNHLGQVALARGDREAAFGRKGSARRHHADAAGWLDEAVRLAAEGGHAIPEGFARKDRALLHVRQGEFEAAAEQLRRAGDLFERARFPEGTAQAQRAEGELRRHTEEFDDSQRLLRAALAWFQANHETDEAARCQFELARTLREAGVSQPLVTRAFREALNRAESCRHAVLVRQVEEEFRESDPEAYLEHVYRRVRGAGLEESPSLGEGEAETLTVLEAHLPGFAAFAAGRDAEAVLMTFNHLQSDFAAVLDEYDGRVLAYAGGGMSAVFRGPRHAERAARAAVALSVALDEFNAPRRILGLPLLRLRTAVESGPAVGGNAGTWRLVDVAVLGEPAERARVLALFAADGRPALGRGAWELARDRLGLPATARTVDTPDGVLEWWEVGEGDSAPTVPPGWV